MDRKMIGQATQKFPSWIRAVCRSQFVFEETEVLELLRIDTMNDLELVYPEYLEKYDFLKRHYLLLSTLTAQRVMDVLHTRESVSYSCPFERSDRSLKSRNTLCCACVKVRDYMHGLSREVIQVDAMGTGRSLVQG